MIRRRLVGRLVQRIAAVGAAVAVAFSGGLGAPSAALATQTHVFCSGCLIFDQNYVADFYSFFLTLVYGHYLGTGTRLMGATAAGFDWVYNNNTVTHGFNGTHYTSGEVANFSGYGQITANAHDDYNG